MAEDLRQILKNVYFSKIGPSLGLKLPPCFVGSFHRICKVDYGKKLASNLKVFSFFNLNNINLTSIIDLLFFIIFQ